ncbi:multiple inositol polyphosphate phosphatase 1 isoform X1 [Xenopus laevis]|uniref:Multiple inositol polyphosphate phosphatase 1 n=2 Tax=Xenopus laevis TaxID=8355 RepID=A0A1L8FIH2_XENLA|nr:multiple inositol polyphosphate phosphatase 1 isoform X1 [Xenopus laevis]XP_018080522.1 multiple inositol polyphosphate phosphatase 1 isoform X1 [Xenopus laevis]OCT71378.1 hypothetical protein XELAEV_18034358mg [Xenopus laevis]
MSFLIAPCRSYIPKPFQILLILGTWLCSSALTSVGTWPAGFNFFFGTKTRYEEVNPFLQKNPLLVIGKQDLLPNTCTPLKIVTVIRHGTRYPTNEQIQKMKKMHDLILKQKGIRSELVEELQQWEMWYDDWMDGQLVKKGEQDMRNLAYRLASLFPLLFSEDKLKQSKMTFTTSSKHRCVDSTKSFISGLVNDYFRFPQTPESGLNELTYMEPVINDTLMRFFDHCPKFLVEVEDNDTALHEVDKFKQSPEMKKVIQKLSALLDVPEQELSADLIQVAFFICSFELAIRNIVDSPWCSLFDEEDARVLEYLNDLKQYWKRGYGYDINSRSSCHLFQHIFQHLETAVTESKSSQQVSMPVVMHFGHAETLLPFLTLLGLFKDETSLKAENFISQIERKFRSGHIVPYASNLAFVLYLCDMTETPNDMTETPREKYQVQLLLNEQLLHFPHSHSSLLFEEMKELYGHLLDGCSISKECAIVKANRSSEDEL